MRTVRRRNLRLPSSQRAYRTAVYAQAYFRSGIANAGGRAACLPGAAADEAAAQAYYEQVVNDYRDELTDLELLRGSTNFAAYLDYQICPKEEGIGFELYLLSEKWPTLVEYLSENAMTHLKALTWALDLCTALTDLRAQGLIHRDVKPENIY